MLVSFGVSKDTGQVSVTYAEGANEVIGDPNVCNTRYMKLPIFSHTSTTLQ